MNEAKDILEKALQDAVNLIESEKLKETADEITSDVDYLIEKIDSNKSIVSALVTSLISLANRYLRYISGFC